MQKNIKGLFYTEFIIIFNLEPYNLSINTFLKFSMMFFNSFSNFSSKFFESRKDFKNSELWFPKCSKKDFSKFFISETSISSKKP